MTRSRGSEMAQRQSPRGQPNLRTSSSDSDSTHPRPKTEKSSSRLAEGRSPREAQSNPLNQKKLGTRIADLESQLGLAQEELKTLKDQLGSTEAAKKVRKDQLERKSKKQQQKVIEPFKVEENRSTPTGTQILNKEEGATARETSDEVQQETDVFEVSVKKVTVEPKAEQDLPADQDEFKPKPVSLSDESPAALVPENPLLHELALKNEEINLLKINLSEKDRDLETIRKENESLKSQLDEKSLKISSTQSEIDELTLRLNKVVQELEESKSSAAEISLKLEAADKAKEGLENEMMKLRVQTEQWRKAADAAASVLAGGKEANGGRISERCGSMDKNYANVIGGYASYVDDSDDAFGGERRKGSGIRMLGDLWRKKGQK